MPEEVRQEEFTCEDCEFRCRREALGVDDHEKLDAYDLLSLRVVKDLRLTPFVFDALGLTFRTSGEALEFLRDLEEIHAVRCPPQPLGELKDPDPDTD